MLNQRRMGLSCSLMDALFVYSGAGFAWGAACILWADTVTCQRKQSWFGVAVRTVLRRCFPKIKLDPFCLVSVTHNLTHNRKRAGGGNGAESTVSSDFSEQKGPKSVRRRCFEGRQSVGKDRETCPCRNNTIINGADSSANTREISNIQHFYCVFQFAAFGLTTYLPTDRKIGPPGNCVPGGP